MRAEPSILHLDLDAFFAAVEQRDKPSLRGKPVIVGGTGGRGVVATASYEARVFGVHSAMPTAEARRRCPHAAFLSGRFDAYRAASRLVMAELRALSPRTEPLSLDEAYVDLQAGRVTDFSDTALLALVDDLKQRVRTVTGGLTASVGLATSKLVAKIASEERKPDGVCLVPAGRERDFLAAKPVSVIPGVGPVTVEKLRRIGVRTVVDLQRAAREDVVQVVGQAAGQSLAELAYGRDDRPVEPERETKSISTERTFETDLTDRARLAELAEADARAVAERLQAARLFARTVTVKVRTYDFRTHTRSRTLGGGTDSPALLTRIARGLLTEIDTADGVRLLGVGAAGLTDAIQSDLFTGEVDSVVPGSSVDAFVFPNVGGTEPAEPVTQPAQELVRTWRPGADVRHERHGPGWVWGSGAGHVTVRFETRETGPGPVRTFGVDDPELVAIDLDSAEPPGPESVEGPVHAPERDQDVLVPNSSPSR